MRVSIFVLPLRPFWGKSIGNETGASEKKVVEARSWKQRERRECRTWKMKSSKDVLENGRDGAKAELKNRQTRFGTGKQNVG